MEKTVAIVAEQEQVEDSKKTFVINEPILISRRVTLEQVEAEIARFQAQLNVAQERLAKLEEDKAAILAAFGK